MLCYAMLWYAMLCYAMLWYAMLCYAMLCYAMVWYGSEDGKNAKKLSIQQIYAIFEDLTKKPPKKLLYSDKRKEKESVNHVYDISGLAPITALINWLSRK
uniref:Uncharacterized protein n=1 Tax=Glossina palpalis gambiensis TaxID=67801 RepID=A0A1B0BCV6_9MUSC